MNLLSLIPIFGWMIAATIAFLCAIPLYFLWNWLAPIYFYFLPDVYLSIPFWHIWGILWLFPIVKSVLFPAFAYPSVNTK